MTKQLTYETYASDLNGSCVRSGKRDMILNDIQFNNKTTT